MGDPQVLMQDPSQKFKAFVVVVVVVVEFIDRCMA